LNDIADRDFDAKVERTRNRPLASGAITVKQAQAFLGALLLLAAGVLVCFNREARIVGLASLPLVIAYPFTKRFTDWPQAFLGLTFNWGALMGWAAVANTLAWPAVLLYGAGFFWTLGYDTIYAHQDKRDDPTAGVKSTALRLLFTSRPWIAGFYAMTIVLFAASGLAEGLGWLFLVGLALGAAQLAWQVWDADLDDPKDCLRKFRSNRLFGWLVLAGIFAGQV
jgi:4-hydroxybenzoate polyprenyltransferase